MPRCGTIHLLANQAPVSVSKTKVLLEERSRSTILPRERSRRQQGHMGRGDTSSIHRTKRGRGHYIVHWALKAPESPSHKTESEYVVHGSRHCPPSRSGVGDRARLLSGDPLLDRQPALSFCQDPHILLQARVHRVPLGLLEVALPLV